MFGKRLKDISEASVAMNVSNGGEMWIFDDINQRVFIASCLSIIAVFGLAGNLLTVIAVALSKKLQTVANVFVLNLTIAAALACSTLPFTIINMIANTDEGVLNTFWCSISGIMSYISFSGTNVAHVLIAFDRFYRITKPHYKYRRMFTKCRVLTMLCFAWLYASTSVIWAVVTQIEFGYSQKYRVCLPDIVDAKVATVSIFRATTIDLFILILVFLCYTAIIFYIYRHNKKLLSMFKPSIERRNHHSPKTPRISDSSYSTSNGFSGGVDNIVMEQTRSIVQTRNGATDDSSVVDIRHTVTPTIDSISTSNFYNGKRNMSVQFKSSREESKTNMLENNIELDNMSEPATCTVYRNERNNDDDNIDDDQDEEFNDDTNEITETNFTERSNTMMTSPAVSLHSKKIRSTLTARQVKITINMFIVVAVYLICITPYMVCLVVEAFERIFPYVAVFYALSNAINPALYAWKHPQFRKVFKPMVLLRFSKIPDPSKLLKFLTAKPSVQYPE